MEDVTSATTTVTPASAPPGRRSFATSECIAGRFRVVRQIAEGGMGIVYEVFDEKLHERRALKCAKPGFAAHLSPEARHSLRVTHPNVCRVFEIHSAHTSIGPVDFLTMELIDGPTLARDIRERGKRPAAEARDIALQICAGIEAAHTQGLLHRDLKSSNVLLTKDSRGAARAVVTDFGLAYESSSPDQWPAATSDAGAPAGTPVYIAPERWRGGRASVASDIYSLGVLLHELVAGTLPVSETDGTKTLAPDLPRRWRRIINRCLERDPSRRYPSAAHVADAIADRRALWRAATWAIGILLPMAFLLWGIAFPPALAARLAVLRIEPADSDSRTVEFANAASSQLSTRLARLRPRPPQLVVIPPEEVGTLETDALARAMGQYGASHVLTATVTRRGSRVAVRAAIVDTVTAVPLKVWSDEYADGDAGAVAAALSALVSSAFRLPRQTGGEAISPAAYAAYAEGSSALRRGMANYAAAVAAFERAAVLDSASVLPYAGLAEAYYDAWFTTGDRHWLQRARDALASARAIDGDALAVRLAAGRVNLVPGSYQLAIEEYRRATELDPSNAAAWSGLARAYQEIQDRNNEAAAAFARAIELQPGYYRPLTDLGAFYRRLGNYDEAEKQWLRVVTLAPDSLAGHSNLGALYSDMGRYADAEKAFTRALEIDPRARIPMGNLGALYQYMGRDEDAIRVLEQSREIGPETHLLLLNLGDSYRRVGRAREASAAYRRARDIAEPILLSNPRDAATRAFVAYYALRLGEPAIAERELAQALSLAPEDRSVIRRAAICFEVMGLRDRTLAVLEAAPIDVVRELSRQPDVIALRGDPRFAAMLSRK